VAEPRGAAEAGRAVKFLAAFLAAFTLAGVAYAAAIRIVDPYGEFGTGVFPPLEPDMRSEKMRLFRAYEAAGPPEGLILGSSRSMKVSPRALERATGRRFFNFAVDNARAEDDLAIYRWVRAQGARLAVVVIGLDVEALHNDDRPEASLLASEPLMRALGPEAPHGRGLLDPLREFGPVRTFKRYKDAFTIRALGDAVRSVGLSLRPASRPLPLMEFEPDGYLRYRRWERERREGTFRFDQDIERCLTKSQARFDGMTGLSARRRAYLRQLVSEARSDGTRVIVWITSLHPLTTRYLAAHTAYPALLADTRAYEQALAGEEKVAVFDFSRPESYEGTASGWYDCIHIDESNAERVTAALLGGRP